MSDTIFIGDTDLANRPIKIIEGYAMAVRHGDTKMVERVNEFLAKIRADGRFKKLQDKYLRELLDAAGKLRQEWRNVKVKGHAEEVLEAVKALNPAYIL